MIKQSILMAVLGLATSFTVLGQEQRTAFVDLDKTFTAFYKTKLADAQLKEQAEQFKGERKEFVDTFQKLQDEFDALREQSQNAAYSEDVRSEKRGEAEEKLVEVREQESKIRRFDESRQKQLDEQSRRMRNRLVDEIKGVVKEYAVEQNFLAVFDSSGNSLNGVDLIVYADMRFDITPAIIDRLNKGKTLEASGETDTP